MAITNALNSAVQAMTAQGIRFQHIGNNIANSSTIGYKSADVSFSENMGLNSGSGLSGLITQPGIGVKINGSITDFKAGQIEDTGNYAQLAITGEGFLSVQAGGVDYVTRAGDFSLMESGTAGEYIFMRPNGSVLMGQTVPGGAITGPVTIQGRPVTVDISATGVLTATGPAVTGTVNASIGVKRFLNSNALSKFEGQMYQETPLSEPFSTDPEIPGSNSAGSLRQGALELSNVDLATEFTRMIVTQRNFQANAKTITTSDELLQVTINLKR